MGFEIVQKVSTVLREFSIYDSKRYSSFKQEIGVFDDYWFLLHVYSDSSEPDYVSVYLYVNCPSPVTVKWISSVNSVTKSLDYTYNKYEGYGFPKYGTKDQLFKDGLMEINSTLTFTFTPQAAEILRMRLSSPRFLMDDEKFKDFTFCVGKQEIKIHKCILSRSSTVFATILEESTTNRLVIDDFEVKIVKAAVNFMYKRELDADLKIKALLNLSRFAYKYQLVDKQQISQKLEEQINLITIRTISNFSKANSMDDLYDKCVDYLAKDFETHICGINDLASLDPTFIVNVTAKYQVYKKAGK
uniref:BTB domain-containing protein n=2 Tax=Panagrolaimus sp. JU765 TaxID=591449 RepID=A0AC34RTJ5_9BILA